MCFGRYNCHALRNGHNSHTGFTGEENRLTLCPSVCPPGDTNLDSTLRLIV